MSQLRNNSTESTQSTESTELTPQQTEVITALARGATVTDATQQANIDRTTYYLWLKNPNFEAELNRAKKEQADARRVQLHGLADTAISTLREILTGADVPAPVRLKAALAVLQSIGTLKSEPNGEIDPEKIERRNSLTFM
jgi:50S ribosomal subunit-associated GTPase HflX